MAVTAKGFIIMVTARAAATTVNVPATPRAGKPNYSFKGSRIHQHPKLLSFTIHNKGR